MIDDFKAFVVCLVLFDPPEEVTKFRELFVVRVDEDSVWFAVPDVKYSEFHLVMILNFILL